MTMSEIAIEKLREALGRAEGRHVLFGGRGVQLFEVEELEEAQAGFRTGSEGQDLCSPHEGDWHPDWVVIGEEDLCSDPLFVDAGTVGFPVFTAMVGEGAWTPTQVAGDFDGFLRALDRVAAISEGRETEEELEDKPLSLEERNEVLKGIGEDNPDLDTRFWESWLEGPGF